MRLQRILRSPLAGAVDGRGDWECNPHSGDPGTCSGRCERRLKGPRTPGQNESRLCNFQQGAETGVLPTQFNADEAAKYLADLVCSHHLGRGLLASFVTANSD